MCGSATVTIGSPARADAARLSTCGPSEYNAVRSS